MTKTSWAYCNSSLMFSIFFLSLSLFTFLFLFNSFPGSFDSLFFYTSLDRLWDGHPYSSWTKTSLYWHLAILPDTRTSWGERHRCVVWAGSFRSWQSHTYHRAEFSPCASPLWWRGIYLHQRFSVDWDKTIGSSFYKKKYGWGLN